MPAPASGDGPTPRARLLVAAGVGLEALLVAAGAVGSAVTSVTALALAAGLVAVALGVRSGRRWARTPTLVWQALQVLVALTTLPLAIGIPLAVLGLAVGYGVLRRDVVES
jgi:coenzyme F420-reducing hydrogenase beta subunit